MRPLLVLLLLAAALAGAAPAHARAPLHTGIAADGLLLAGDPAEADEAVADWKRLGVDRVRLQVPWSRVAPDPAALSAPAGFNGANPDDPGYRWDAVDAAVRRLDRAGIEPILMVNGPPPLWASSEPGLQNVRWQPQAWRFGEFAAAVAARFGSVADEYILWNEPNLPLWLQPQARCVKRSCTPVSPHVYRYMVRAAYPAIHAADPRATVLVGALAPTGSNLRSRNANMRPLQFLRAFGCVDAALRPITTGPCRTFEPATADGFSYHPHPTKHAPDEHYPHPDDASLAGLKRVERVLDALQRDGRLVGTTTPLGLWLDEFAYQTNPPDKLRGVTPGRQDRYLQQAAYVAWRHPRVRLLAQYLWRDEALREGKGYPGWQSGLLTPEGKPKPALAHFDDPLWADLQRGTIWGQVRPGDEHDVRVEVRPAGSATGWQPLGQTRTAADGTWSMRTKVEPYASYRAIADGERVSGTAVALPPGADADPEEGSDPEAPPVPVERRAVAPVAGAPVPPSFAGLSMEYRSVPDLIGTGGVVNPIFARLVDRLADEGSGAPTLRFGGDSTDLSWWNPERLPRPAEIETDLDPAWLAHLATWRARTGTPLLLGLNLGMGDHPRAAAMADAAAAALGPAGLAGFEIGNEPDLYASPRRYWVGRTLRVRGQKRPPGYDYAQYRDEVDAHVAAVAPASRGVPIVGGGFAGAAWDDHQADLFERLPAIRSYCAHAYPLKTCDPAVRTRGAAQLPKLLAANAYAPIVTRMRHLAGVAAAHGATVRVSEMNSAICGGLRGVSDTFASALWGTDVLFGLADAGVRSVGFHTWTGSIYGPVAFSRAQGRTVGHVRPLFYAMLLFSRATPPGSRLVSVGPNPARGALKTWGTVDPAGTTRIVVINKDPLNERVVSLGVGGASRVARIERLSAPKLGSVNNVTLAGQGWGGSTRDGKLRGRRRAERTRVAAGSVPVRMPAGSAALVVVPPSPAAAPARPPARRR